MAVGVAEALLRIEDFQPREPAFAIIISRDAFGEVLCCHGGFAERGSLTHSFVASTLG